MLSPNVLPTQDAGTTVFIKCKLEDCDEPTPFLPLCVRRPFVHGRRRTQRVCAVPCMQTCAHGAVSSHGADVLYVGAPATTYATCVFTLRYNWHAIGENVRLNAAVALHSTPTVLSATTGIALVIGGLDLWLPRVRYRWR